MHQKVIALLLCMFLLIPTVAFAAQEQNEPLDAQVILTRKQRDILRALGVAENEIDNLSGPEIGEIVLVGNIVDYSYIEQYLPSSAELIQGVRQAEIELESAVKMLSSISATEEDVIFYLRIYSWRCFRHNICTNCNVCSLQ